MNKLEIIEKIEQLKRKKNKFENLDEYYNKINSLYHQLSDAIGKKKLQKNYDEIISKIEEDIMNLDTQLYLFEKPDVKLLSKKYPLFDLFLIENNLINQDTNTKYIIQTKPIIEENYDNNELVWDIKFLLKLTEIVSGKKNKAIMALILYDLIFRKFNICLEHEKFKKTVKDKLKEFEYEKDTFDDITNKYGLGNDIIDVFQKAFDTWG